MHLLRRRPRSRRQQGGVREVRRQSPGRRQAAALRRDVLDQVAAGGRRRDHRADLQGARGQARLRLRRLGLEDGLPRDHRVVRQERTVMPGLVTHIRFAVGALALALLVFVCPLPATAQQSNPDGSVNPTASSVNEDKLFQQLDRISGRCSIPDQKACTIEQPAGRDWRHFHEVTLRWIGVISILGMLALLVIFYLVRGMVRLESGRSGRVLMRFSAFERLVHWMTAACFILLAISGLNITFGRPLLLPLIGPDAFTVWSQWAKYAHNYLSFPFTLGVFTIFLMWIAWNIPNRADVEWLKRGGGIVGHKHPPAYRFNAGQKMIYWIVVLGGGIVAASGYVLMFPFYGTDISGMETAQVIHGVVAGLVVGVVLALMYSGT